MIASSQGIDSWARDVFARLVNCDPLGHVIARADLVDCDSMTELDESGSRCSYVPGAFVFNLQNVQPVTPIPIKGRLGIFESNIDSADLEFIQK